MIVLFLKRKIQLRKQIKNVGVSIIGWKKHRVIIDNTIVFLNYNVIDQIIQQ